MARWKDDNMLMQETLLKLMDTPEMQDYLNDSEAQRRAAEIYEGLKPYKPEEEPDDYTDGWHEGYYGDHSILVNCDDYTSCKLYDTVTGYIYDEETIIYPLFNLYKSLEGKPARKRYPTDDHFDAWVEDHKREIRRQMRKVLRRYGLSE